MRNDIYTLPQDVFVAGQSFGYAWRLFTKSGTPFNADGCVGNFAVINYSNKHGTPEISKPVEFQRGDSGVINLATVELTPSDTLDLFGKYIYQLTIKDIDGNIEIPNQGILLISKNINEAYIR